MTTYRLFGGKPADFTVDTATVLASPSGTAEALVLEGGASLDAWNAISGGSKLTDLLMLDPPASQGSAAPGGVFPAQPDGTILVWVPTDVAQVWVVKTGGTGQRWQLTPIDEHDRLLLIEAAAYIPASAAGANNGVAQLDNTGKVPAGQLPAAAGGVTTVNGAAGAVVLNEANTGFVPNTRKVNAGTGMTVNNSGKLDQDLTIAASIGTGAGNVAAGNHTHGGFTTSPRPVVVQVLSNDADTAWKTAASADAYTLVCDGTNDEVQIQQAIDLAAPLQSRNAAMPAGAKQVGKVQLGGGRFFIGAAGIKMRTAVWLDGNGKGTEVRAVGCNQPGMIGLAAPSDHLCEVSNMQLWGNTSGGGSCSAIDFDMTDGANTSGYPDANPDSDHFIHNLFIDEFRGTGRHGVYLHAAPTVAVPNPHNRGNMVKDLQIRDCTGGNGIYFDGASDSYIECCHVGGSGDTGYRIAGGNTKMSDNKSFFSNNCGVWVTSGRANVVGHESQDESTGLFFDGVPGTAVGLVVDTCDVAGIRVSNDRLQIMGFNAFVRSGGRYTTQQRGLWYDGAFTFCSIIGNVENANMTTPISGTPATGTNFVTVS